MFFFYLPNAFKLITKIIILFKMTLKKSLVIHKIFAITFCHLRVFINICVPNEKEKKWWRREREGISRVLAK